MGSAESGAAVEEQVLHLFQKKPIIEIPSQWDAPEKMQTHTEKAITDMSPLIAQAYIPFNDLVCMVDLLRLNNKGQYDLIEVKSKSSIRKSTKAAPLLDDLIADLSFQRYVLSQVLGDTFSGQCYFYYVNKEYVRDGAIDPRQLIQVEEVSKELISDEVVITGINRLKEEVQLSESEINARYPYNGERYELYYGQEPPVGSVWRIPGSIKKLSSQILNGLSSIMEMTERDIQLLYRADGSVSNQAEYVHKYQQAETIINHHAIRDILDRYPMPYFFYDYETISSPVPLLDGTSPNQQVVVQYSLHELTDHGKEAHHFDCIIGPVSVPTGE
ncbi:MAG: DUF2779 domain-containing protein [Saprospiraceae bacterium]|nr:DUF2779 domain-containing protein [Saprospiraceae bacterium]